MLANSKSNKTHLIREKCRECRFDGDGDDDDVVYALLMLIKWNVKRLAFYFLKCESETHRVDEVFDGKAFLKCMGRINKKNIGRGFSAKSDCVRVRFPIGCYSILKRIYFK